ncbi:MAG: M14 family zinc carboxypeptidase [Velocimicrobium sp.]
MRIQIKKTRVWIIIYIFICCFYTVPVTIQAEELFDVQKIDIANTKNTVKINWNEVKACDEYEVIVLDSSEEKVEVVLSENSAVFDGKAEESYQIKIMTWKNKELMGEGVSIEIRIPGKIKTIQTTSVSKKCVHLVWNRDKYANYYEVRRKRKGLDGYEVLKVTKRNDFYDKRIKDNQAYVYEVVPLFKGSDSILLYGKAKKYSFNNKEIVDTSNARYTYKEYEADVKQLQMKYSQYCATSVIGKTVDNRNLYKIELGNPDATKHLLVVANLHAREYMTSLLCMKQIEYYLEHYNKSIAGCKPIDLLDTMSIIYIPMANPDGVTLVQEGISGIDSDKLRKKLYAMMGTTSAADWKANANGVDLNRNFKVGFGKGNRKKAGAAGYAGKYALSENETKAIAQVIKKLNKNKHTIVAIVNYHAAGEIIFSSVPTSASKSISLLTKKMNSCAREVTGYGNAETVNKATATGDFRSYHMRVFRIPGITLEIGKGKTPVPYSEFASIWKKNKLLIMEEVKVIQ